MATRPFKLVLWSMAVVLFLGAAAAAGAAYALSPVNRQGAARVVVIRAGSTSQEIGGQLEAAGLVRRAAYFELLARLRKVSRSLHHGEYRLSPAMSLPRLLEIIARGEVVLHSVTIPEGYTAAQIVEALAASGLGEAGALQAVVEGGRALFPHEFLRNLPSARLEGYLFPDTYFLPRYAAASEVIAPFLDRFEAVVVPLWRAQGRGRSLPAIVTMASLVEREAKSAGDQVLIAGVLYNRLRKGMRLEVDATVLYALGRHKAVVTFEDLKVASPYNTYLHAGLPPGPISNPGLGAVRAALAPAVTDYLYYVAKPDGSHAFSRTLREHLAAVKRYRRP